MHDAWSAVGNGPFLFRRGFFPTSPARVVARTGHAVMTSVWGGVNGLGFCYALGRINSLPDCLVWWSKRLRISVGCCPEVWMVAHSGTRGRWRGTEGTAACCIVFWALLSLSLFVQRRQALLATMQFHMPEESWNLALITAGLPYTGLA